MLTSPKFQSYQGGFWSITRDIPPPRSALSIHTSPAPPWPLASSTQHSPSLSGVRKVWKTGGFKDSMNLDSTTDSGSSWSFSGRR